MRLLGHWGALRKEIQAISTLLNDQNDFFCLLASQTLLAKKKTIFEVLNLVLNGLLVAAFVGSQLRM